MKTCIAKEAKLSLTLTDLFQSFGFASLARHQVVYQAQQSGWLTSGSSDLAHVLENESRGWSALLGEVVAVTVPVITIVLYADNQPDQPIRTYPVPVYILRQFADPFYGVCGQSILRLIDAHFGGFSGRVSFIPIPPCRALIPPLG